MTRGVWIFDKEQGKLVPKGEYYMRKSAPSTTIIKDIEPYKNVVDGRVIGGRRQHRDFLRARGLVEVGNEQVTKQYEAPKGLGDDIRRAMQETGYWKQ